MVRVATFNVNGVNGRLPVLLAWLKATHYDVVCLQELKNSDEKFPAEAIKADTEPGLEKWLEVNTEYAKSWPNITQKKDQPPDAKEFEGVEGKFEKYFSKEPGSGD